MADIELLKRLAEAVQGLNLESAWSWAQTIRDGRLGRTTTAYALEVSPEAILALIAENEWLKLIEDGWNEWNAKTEWVQETAEPHELGKHRADALRGRIDQLKAELERARADAERYAWLRERGDACQWMNIIRVDPEDYDNLDAAIDAAMGKGGGQNGSKAAETRASAGLEGGGHGGNSGGAE